MTTAGENLVQRSGLPSGTALAHFLAIQGSGADRIIYASQMAVLVESPQVSVMQIPRREDRSEHRPAICRLSADAHDKAVSVFTRNAELFIVTMIDELTVQQLRNESLFVQDLGKESFTVRQSDMLEMIDG